MNEPIEIPSRALKIWVAVTGGLFWFLVAAWLCFFAAWGALHGWIVPRIADFRPRIEAEASKALGVPVQIGAISARSEGLVPSFTLGDVALLDAQGRAALRLPQVVVALSPRSLWNHGFEQLYLGAPELDVRRTADGRILVAGIAISADGADDGSAAADWLFS
uniref:YhdP family protein n=1 Tax=Xylophilus sp. ASV27 TaxID=2795129 RepID=UPI004040A2D4